MSFERRWAGLRARFDGVALQAPKRAPLPTEAALLADRADTVRELAEWCHTPARRGAPGAWHSAATQDLSVATLLGPDAASTTAFASAFARQIDGSAALEAMPTASGIVFRLGVKLHDAMWWRPRQPSDPWDAGWASTAPPAQRRLEGHFLPRRATLILAPGEDSTALTLALAQLDQRSDEFDHPVRWLWVGPPTHARAEHLRPALTVQLS
jgi:hypothetical protein